MITCLFDYVGLNGVTTPNSGIFLNELPGIETTKLDEIRKDETYDIEDAWHDIQNRAIREFERRVAKWGQKFMGNRSYISNQLTGQYDSNDPVSLSSDLAGWLFDGNLGFYKNMSVVIPHVDLYTTNTVQSSIFVYNATTGDLLDEFPFPFVANEINRVPINKEYPAWQYPKLFICYDETEVSTIKVKDIYYDLTFTANQGRVTKGSPVIKDNISGTQNLGQGLIVSYSVSCSWNNFICQRLNAFESPWLKLLAYEFCQEIVFSDRINRFTLLKRPRALELSEKYLNEFQEEINEILNSITIDQLTWHNDEFCFYCDKSLNYRAYVP